MTRALIIAYNYPPLNNGGVPRSLKIEKYFPEMGIAPIILAPSFKGPVLKVEDNVIRIRDFARDSDGQRLKLFLRAARKTFRIFGKYFSAYELWKRQAGRYASIILEKSRPDVILASFPPVSALELGLMLAQTAEIPFIPDFRDGLVYEPAGPGQEYSHIQDYYRELERKVVKKASTIVTVSNVISDYFRREYQIENVHTVTNGYDPDDFRELPLTLNINSKKFNIVYTGRLSLSDIACNATAFFDAMDDIAAADTELTSRIHLHMIGQFTREESSRIDQLVKRGIATRQNMLDKKTALAYQKVANLLLLVTSARRKSVITGKLFEYLYSNKPILGLTHGTAAAKIIEQTGSGWTVHPHRKDEIIGILSRLIRVPEFYHSLERSHQRIEAYSFRHQINNLAQLINRTISRTII